MQVSVIGLGYVGATQAVGLASFGHDVIAVDKDPQRLAQLRSGRAPFHEPGLERLLRDGLDARRLQFSDDIEAVSGADAHFVCVGTPQAVDSLAADLSALWLVADAMAPLLRTGAVVVGKSTVPVGTAVELQARLRSRAPAGGDVHVAWNPEFLREGHAVSDWLAPNRIVFGAMSHKAMEILSAIYAPLVDRGVPVICTDLETAELAKASANALLAARISTVNLLAELCASSGADIDALVRIVGLDPRIGAHYLSPGIGFGGSCLPKDVRALTARGEQLGIGESLGLLRQVDEVNLRQRARALDLACSLLRQPAAQVALLGAAFKGGSDDVRDSPALDLAAGLRDRGHRVRVFDPLALHKAAAVEPDLDYAPSIDEACRDADLVVVATDAPEFLKLDPVRLLTVVASPVVLDGRTVLDQAAWTTAGWTVQTLGGASGGSRRL